MGILATELNPNNDIKLPSPAYRKLVACALVYKVNGELNRKAQKIAEDKFSSCKISKRVSAKPCHIRIRKLECKQS